MTAERASEKDRDYFRRLGEWKAQSNADALREHVALPAQERLRRSERLYRNSIGYANKRHTEPEGRSIFDLAKALGIYRP